MFTPLDILYIVLAFCVLWITAGLFWLVWQAATLLRAVNVTMVVARERLEKIEEALSGIRSRFETVSSGVAANVIMTGGRKIADYFMDTKKRKKKSD